MKPTSRAADTEMKHLRLQEELELARQQIKYEHCREEDERYREEDERRREEDERRREEAERLLVEEAPFREAEMLRRERLSQLEAAVTRKTFEVRRKRLISDSHSSEVSHPPLANLLIDPPKLRTTSWVEVQRLIVHHTIPNPSLTSHTQCHNPQFDQGGASEQIC